MANARVFGWWLVLVAGIAGLTWAALTLASAWLASIAERVN